MGGGNTQQAAARKASTNEFHFTSTHRHIELIDELVTAGVVTSRSEALRRAFFEAKAANTALFSTLPRKAT